MRTLSNLVRCVAAVRGRDAVSAAAFRGENARCLLRPPDLCRRHDAKQAAEARGKALVFTVE